MIKAILFDFIETLGSAADGFRKAEKAVQERLLSDLGHPDPESFLEVYRRERGRLRRRSCFSRRALWSRVCEELGRPCPPDRLARWEDEYWTTVEEDMRLFPETLAVLEGLASRYRLGLVTNQQREGSTRGLSFAAFNEVARFFPVVVVCGEAGIPAKPAPQPFHEALYRIGAAADEALYVGDDWEVDIQGARSAGIRPVWIRHETVRRNWPAGDGQVATISSLRELLELERLLEVERSRR